MNKVFPIIVVPYDPDWVRMFGAEAALLRSRLPLDVVTRIEHYGSTAVPGLAAKPVIDILVAVTSFQAAEPTCVPILKELGYGFDWYSGHMAFFKGYFTDDAVKYHIHMAPCDHPLMHNLLFRDYLRAHPDAAKRYEKLKYELAELHRTDREAYTDAKGEFVAEIIALARTELPSG